MTTLAPTTPVRADSAAYKLGRTYPDVPDETKARLFAQVKADERYSDYLHGCFECGICVAACPSARFYDFSPRRIAQAAAREDVELFYQQLEEDIWECSQCYSCLRCPRGNSPGGLVMLMREVAVSNGLASARRALRGYTRIIYKIMSTGTQVSPDMLRGDAFPDWGPSVQTLSDNLDVWVYARCHQRRCIRRAPGGTSLPQTLVELYLIWHRTGALGVTPRLDPSWHDLLEEVMEDVLDEYGYELGEEG